MTFVAFVVVVICWNLLRLRLRALELLITHARLRYWLIRGCVCVCVYVTVTFGYPTAALADFVTRIYGVTRTPPVARFTPFTTRYAAVVAVAFYVTRYVCLILFTLPLRLRSVSVTRSVYGLQFSRCTLVTHGLRARLRAAAARITVGLRYPVGLRCWIAHGYVYTTV